MTGVEPAALEVATRRMRRPPRLLTLIAISALGALSLNMFLPSLPGMARDFGVDYGIMQLSVSAYLGASAVMQFVAGPLSDRFGRRRVMLGALVIFALATVGTLQAPTAGWFLGFRMVQSVVTAGFVLPRAVIRDIAPPDQSASLIGYLTMGMSVVPMLAPILGGLLDERFGWQGSFVVLLVSGLAVLAWTWRDMGETAAGGGLSLREQARGYPALFGAARYWGYVGAATFASGGFFAYVGGAPFVGAEVFRMTPAEVGYWFMAPSLGYLAGNFVAGRWSARIGIDRMILAGALITLGCLAAALAADLAGLTRPAVFFGAVAVMGFGNGLVLPNANAGMMTVSPEIAGTAVGLGSALNVAGGAVLATLAGVLLVPGAGATPLIVIMAGSALAALASTLLLRRVD